MKANSIVLAIFLLAIFLPGSRAESFPPPDSTVHLNAAAIPVPTLKLTAPTFQRGGLILFRVDSTEQFKVLIESSADLANWTFEGLREPNDELVLTNKNGPGERRFFRAADYTSRIHGIVRDIETDLPLAQAKVTISSHSWMAKDVVTETDAQGLFHAVLSREHSFRQITVEKTGYELLTTVLPFGSFTPNGQLSLRLAPPGYRPPNDDFQNRFVLEGTNLTVQARTFAATSEPGHELFILFDDYGESYPRNLWWTWTAPTNGAVLIQRNQAPVRYESGVIVYTGQSLPELEPLWDTSNPENAFFVKQGVQYQICFGTASPAETGFTFSMVAPVPPVGLRAWVGGQLYLGSPERAVGEALYLSATANGTSPLTYQWRKNGLNIPGATNTLFFKRDLELEDAGSYSVLVTNEAGTALSEAIQITVLPERPQRPELLQGVWTQETSQGPLIISFAGREFTAKWASDNSFAGSGHYRFSETDSPGHYRLLMTYTEPSPEVVRYFLVTLTNPDTGSYHETGSIWYHTVDHDSGAFTRLPPP